MFFHKNKLYAKEVKDDLFSCFVPVKEQEKRTELMDVSPVWHGKGHITLSQWREMLAFFYWGYSKTRSEQIITIYYNFEKQDFLFYPYPQICVGMTVREDEHKKSEAKEKYIPQGYVFFGTVHHHCDSSAFQSSVDERDESIGFHATIGHISSDVHSLHTRWIVRNSETGEKITYENNAKEEIVGLNMFSLFNPVLNNEITNTKDFFLLLRKELTLKSNSSFPEHWKESVPEKATSYHSFGRQSYIGYQTYGGVQNSSNHFGYYGAQNRYDPEDDFFDVYDDDREWVDQSITTEENVDLVAKYLKTNGYLGLSDDSLRLEAISKLSRPTGFALLKEAKKNLSQKKNEGTTKTQESSVYDSWSVILGENSRLPCYYSKFYQQMLKSDGEFFDRDFYSYDFKGAHLFARALKKHNEKGVFLHPEIINGTALFPISEFKLSTANSKDIRVYFSFVSFQKAEAKTALVFDGITEVPVAWVGDPTGDKEPLYLAMAVSQAWINEPEVKKFAESIVEKWNLIINERKVIPKYTLVFAIDNHDKSPEIKETSYIYYDRYYSNKSNLATYGNDITRTMSFGNLDDDCYTAQENIASYFKRFFLLSETSDITNYISITETTDLLLEGTTVEMFLEKLFGITLGDIPSMFEELMKRHWNIIPYIITKKQYSLLQVYDCLSLTSTYDKNELESKFLYLCEADPTEVMFALIRASILANTSYGDDWVTYEVINASVDTTHESSVALYCELLHLLTNNDLSLTTKTKL